MSKVAKRRSSAEYAVCQLTRSSWVVFFNGRLIAGAVLGSLRSALGYVNSLAEASGLAPTRLVVEPIPHH